MMFNFDRIMCASLRRSWHANLTSTKVFITRQPASVYSECFNRHFSANLAPGPSAGGLNTGGHDGRMVGLASV